MASSASDINKIYLEMSKLSNQTQIKLQDMTNQSTAKSFEYNAKEAEKSRSWQTQMSNTSHQREVKDLIKAGLNPVLSSGGSGAQSYTTSSASAAADNAASAVGQLAASRMSGLANMGSSKIGADATRAAAASNAAAMRYAAQQSAAAQRYAADAARYSASMSYQAQVYAANKNAETQKYRADVDERMNKYRIDRQIANNPIAFADKWLQNMGISPSIAKGVDNLWNGKKGIMDSYKRGLLGYKETGKFLFDKISTNITNNALRKLQLDVNANNRLLFAKAMIVGDKTAQAIFRSKIRKAQSDNIAYTIKNAVRFF